MAKAEDIGWRMIERRNNGFESDEDSAPYVASIAIQRKAQLMQDGYFQSTEERLIPPASASTFAILMVRHMKLLQWEHVDYLYKRLKEQGLEKRDAAALANESIPKRRVPADSRVDAEETREKGGPSA